MRGRGLLVLTVALALVASGFPKASAATRYVDEIFPDVDITRDLAYGHAVNSRGEDQTLLFDLYTPHGDTEIGRGLYIWATGGNFRSANKNSIGPLLGFVRRGWVGFSITYRVRPELPPGAALGALLAPEQLPPFIQATKDAQHDMQAAVRYARVHADELGIDPDKIAIGGMSAGAITSLMVAFNPDDPGDSGNEGPSSAVAAAVSHAGTYAPVLLGAPPLPGAPPIAMYHGTFYEQVPYPTNFLPCLLTIAALNTCETTTFVGRHHEILGADLARDFLYRKVILEEPTQPLNVASVLGVDVPSDPTVITDGAEYMLRYWLNVVGLDLPF